MKFVHKFIILGLSLTSVACGVDQKSENAAEESCALAAECAGAVLVDEDKCVADQVEEHQKFKDKYGSDCLSKVLDVQNCINDNFTCEDGDTESPALGVCEDEFLDALDECGLDAFADLDESDEESFDDQGF